MPSSATSLNFCDKRIVEGDAQWAEIVEKVHKPPLEINVINFELNGFNPSILVPWSPSDTKKFDRSIQIHMIGGKRKDAFLHLF